MVAKLANGPHMYKDENADFAEVEDQGYWDKSLADKRARHLWQQDGVYACVWPVRFWAPLMPVVAPTPPLVPRLTMGATTDDTGMKLYAYAEDKHPRLKQKTSRDDLPAYVASAWRAWALGQAEQGNIYEAGQELPSAESLAPLFDPSTPSDRPLPGQLPLPGL